MPEFTPSISYATIAVVFGWIVTGAFQTFRLGSTITKYRLEVERQGQDLKALKDDMKTQQQERDEQRMAVLAATSAATAAAAAARDAVERLTLLQTSFAMYRETQAERLVSRDVLREVRNELTEAIERLGTRIDLALRETTTRRA